jgi:hypothetical protein
MEEEVQIYPIIKEKKKDPNTLFGILCLIGTCIICFVFPSLFSFHTFCVYQTSYIKHNGGDAIVTYTMFYYPVTLFFQSIFGLIAGIVFAKLGVHWSNLIGSAIYILAGVIMYISARFYLDMISSVLYGIACAILAFPSIVNTCKYFMSSVGLINGIIATSQSLGTTLFTYIGEQMINPDRVQSDPIDHLYNAEISKNVKKFLLLQIFCVLGSFIICEMLTKTYDEKNKEEFSIKFLFRVNEIKKLCNKKKNENLLLIQTSDDVFSINPEAKEDKINKNKIVKSDKKSKTRKEKIKMVLKSWKFWRYNLISLSSSPITDMIFSMYRSLGETYQINQNTLQLLGILNSVIGFIFSFIFGVLCDYVDFRVLLFVNNMIGSIIGLAYYHSFHDSLIFSILTLVISIQSAGYYCLKEYHLIKVFGIDLLVDLSGVVSLTTGFCVIILTIFTYIMEITLEEKDFAYLIIFPIFGLFNFIGVVLGFFEDNEPFDYGE